MLNDEHMLGSTLIGAAVLLGDGTAPSKCEAEAHELESGPPELQSTSGHIGSSNEPRKSRSSRIASDAEALNALNRGLG